MDNIQGVVDSHEFVTAILPLYRDTQVKIRVVPSNKEYTISKAIICAESPVFSAMFEGNFQESQIRTVEIEEMKDVVSVQSVEAFIMWLYLRTVRFDVPKGTEECISAPLELARLADMYKIIKLEEDVAQYIKKKVYQPCVSQLPLEDQPHQLQRGPHLLVLPPVRVVRAMWVDYRAVWLDYNVLRISSEHIISATALPYGHPVRKLMASASIRDYLVDNTDKFSKLIEAHPSFGADILQQVRPALIQLEKNIKPSN
ncbi:unnamed protein product [Penicillium salamii]|uniref:BTB domain-containing protein n=1 Tax=Penicillium salamii TaxID=1612424 RepID=A0A9W4K149_9EURO|nr:unnamed protein product [Penicillium salamii]CAG8046554.1 unnamed protein product [Penicillium salamii]CAG8109953.1 unnamed protein product [Penicillium salamii]CAG8143034.1 unnamed protein product [Penicillium salamii]CAG8174583.1 unnamed protein product [Penicillium salamii]